MNPLLSKSQTVFPGTNELCVIMHRRCIQLWIKHKPMTGDNEIISHIEVEPKWPTFCRRHFQMHFLKWKCMNFDENARLKFVPMGPSGNIPALVQILAWRQLGDKPLSEPMMARLSTHIYVSWPQWLKHVDFNIYTYDNIRQSSSILSKSKHQHASIICIPPPPPPPIFRRVLFPCYWTYNQKMY